MQELVAMQRARALDAAEGTVDWEQVAQMLGTRRTHASVQQHWYMLSRETAGEPPGIEAPQPPCVKKPFVWVVPVVVVVPA